MRPSSLPVPAPAAAAHVSADPSAYEIRVASSDAELLAACDVRRVAYGHHLGEASGAFAGIEPQDRASGHVVLLCCERTTGQVLGTARITPGDAAKALSIERSLILPHHLARSQRAEVTRLAVLPGAASIVKLGLMKAVYDYCLAHHIEWLVIAARSEALARGYRRLGFEDFLAPGQMLPLACAGNLPHVVLTMPVPAMAARWRRASHRLCSFMLAEAPAGWPNWQGLATARPPLLSPVPQRSLVA